MRTGRLLSWIAAGVAGAIALAWVFPEAYPLLPLQGWRISKGEAVTIARERLRDLGEPVTDPYLVARLNSDELLDHRLQLAAREVGAGELRESRLGHELLLWEVTVYPPGVGSSEWVYRAQLCLSGEVHALRLRLPGDAAGGRIDPERAQVAAAEFLVEQGFDPGDFGEPMVRTQELRARTDTVLRYPYRERLLGEEFVYGVEVTFAGARLAGFDSFYQDPREAEMKASIRPALMRNWAHIFAVLFLLPVVAVSFVRRYHAGEVGVRRGTQIFMVLMSASLVLLVMTSRPATEGWQVGFLSRQQLTWWWGLQMVFFFFLPLSLVTFLSWSVGEALCRQRWSEKLAAFDAMWSGDFGNATVARAALRGTVAGVLLLALQLGAAALLRRGGALTLMSAGGGPWWENAAWPGVALLAFAVSMVVYGELFGRLLLVPMAVRRFGLLSGAALAVVISAAVVWCPGPEILQSGWAIVFALATFGVLVGLFLRYDLLTALLASLVAWVVLAALPFVLAADPSLQFQGSLALLGAALPLVLSVRHLGSGREFVYRYEDVPPHVRRIAERERHKIELETAREIQSSILPRLPPQLNGVEIAHTYLPATEVGGDFYDVVGLDDGRLAVALGDVAGHGVSSGLVMSAAKSALAVQITFDPEVEAVFQTLNRLVYQSARRRLLATLCYLLIDLVRREMVYASAGHLFPYRVGGDGRIAALESISYPLGVRRRLLPAVRRERLRQGDQLVLFSDGVVESRAPANEELFGFERLEESLLRHAGKGPVALRDGLLADLARFAGDGPREDDLTVLVLQVP